MGVNYYGHSIRYSAEQTQHMAKQQASRPKVGAGTRTDALALAGRSFYEW